MTNPSRTWFAVLLISLLVTTRLAASQTVDSVASIVQRSALIAHVSVVGEVQFGDRRVQFVEILDSARGHGVGQLAMISVDSREGETKESPLKWKPGEQFILFAERDDRGMYRPLSATLRATDTDTDTAKLRALVPPQSPPTVASVVAHLRNECRQRDLRLTVTLNQRDIRNYEPDAPMRVEITIDNIGGDDFSMQNRIKYEFCNSHFVDREKALEQIRDESFSPPVKICLRRLGLRYALHDIARMEHQLAAGVSIAPGQQARATYDLAEEYDIQGGGRFHVWAEVGAHRSQPVLLELPEAEEALEELKKMAELAVDDGGPFQIVRQSPTATHSMPDVGATVAGDAIAAALSFWFREAQEGTEIVMLRTPNLPDEFAPKIAGIQFLISDVQWRDDGEAAALKTSQGEATFRWRTVRIESVKVQGNHATVDVVQNDRHNLGGSGATIPLQREDGQWQVAGVVQLWQR